ncbi:alpha/beta hydrolase [Permianibacter sp. IMCC34836]|uniref:alpha/beta fold hydrolase n=1 Tax=Permianibacter fluminis TaxID=2738515 RepID=UPI001556B25F|nr:alpha/beta hydrolase [Permianibacter fluminis]NQD37791.1 alpha/beta hydrolase [Permianibacter fluminis]
MTKTVSVQRVKAGLLDVAYLDSGATDGVPVVLLHGFPYDIHAFAAVTPILLAQGCRVITPYLRGYGPTRFLSDDTMRSGQQAALAQDLHALMNALAIPRAIVAGYDWGGRAACIAAALWPERVIGLVSDGYTIQHIAGAAKPLPPEEEFRYWYQYYFHTERGRAGLETYRRELCRLLWQLWSPDWRFDEPTFAQTAAAFDNPDFVEVVIHSYRHRFGLVPGDAAYAELERQLAKQPLISVPTILVQGAGDGVAAPVEASVDQPFFTGFYENRILPAVGHNLPQEAPQAFADAVLSLLRLRER